MPRGFSIMESVVGIFTITLVLLATYSTFILSQQTHRKVDDRAEVVQNERAVLDRMARELRQANVIATTLPTNEIMFEDGHGNLENNPIQYLRYHLSGTDLYREVRYYYFASDPETHVRYNETDDQGYAPDSQTTEDRLIGEYVNSLTFSGSATITISLILSRNNQTVTLSTDVAPRNVN